jgi:hypothetical protein
MLFLLFNAACSSPEEPVPGDDPHFAIYLPADSTTKIMDWFGEDLDSIAISNEPWLTDEDLLLYDFSSHAMYLKGVRSDFLGYSSTDPGMFAASWCDRPFLVVAGGVRAYPGQVSCMVMSPTVVVPEITDLASPLYPTNVMFIEWSWLFHDDVDLRQNELVRSALIDAGIYHAGLSIELVSLTLQGSEEVSTVEYTFTLSNNDVDALYVPDPAQMGDSLYHYYTNGLACYNQGSGSYHQRTHSSLDVTFGWDRWDADWYVRVPSGGSIIRTTVVDGISRLIPGRYSCVITHGVPKKVPEAELITEQGRYWLGHRFSEALSVTIGDDGASVVVHR